MQLTPTLMQATENNLRHWWYTASVHRKWQWFWACCVACGLLASSPPETFADQLSDSASSRPLHLVAQAGVYGALGGPAPWGSSLSVDLLPGYIAGRYGLRGEWRGYRDSSRGSILAGLLFEAGASRPQLALKLVAEAGVSEDNRPIVGGGVEWSLWFLGPVGVTTLTDFQIIIDGTDTRPALSATLCLHLGR
jgi:hypothetical protein